MKKATILIVEDEFIVAATIKTFLERSGYEVLFITASGEDALVTAERDSRTLFSWIFTSKDGWIISHYRTRSLPPVKIILLTCK